MRLLPPAKEASRAQARLDWSGGIVAVVGRDALRADGTSIGPGHVWSWQETGQLIRRGRGLKGAAGARQQGELCKAATRRAQQKAVRRDQAGERRGGGKNPFDEAFGHRTQAHGTRFRACFKSHGTTVSPHPEEA